MKLIKIQLVMMLLMLGSYSSAAVEQACGEVAEIKEDLASRNLFKLKFLVYTYRYNYSGGVGPTISPVSPDVLAGVLTPAQHGFVGARGLDVIPATIIQKEVLYNAFNLRKNLAFVCFSRDTAVAGSKPEIFMMNSHMTR